MSDTPRTDAEAIWADASAGQDQWQGVPVEFARQLERELNALKALHPEGRECIGIVVGHEKPGMARVAWTDGGLRPVGMRVYNGDQSTPQPEPSK